MDCSPPGSSIHGIFQTRVLEWIAISFFRGSSGPRDWTLVSRIVRRRSSFWALGKSLKQSKPLIYSSSLLFVVNNDASGFISVFFVSKLPVLILCTSYPSFLIYNILVIYFSILSGCPANRVSFGTEETASLYAVGFPEEYETFGL